MQCLLHLWCKWLKWKCLAIWDSNKKDEDKLKRWHSHCLFVHNLSCTVRNSKNLRAIMREPEMPEIFFYLSLEMTRKNAVINDKLNNSPAFTSMCIHEHRVGNALQGRPGHTVLTATQHCSWICGSGLLLLPQVLEMLCIGQKVRQVLEYRSLYVHGAWH